MTPTVLAITGLGADGLGADGLTRDERETLTLAGRLARRTGAQLHAVTLGVPDDDTHEELCHLGVDAVEVVTHDRLAADAPPAAVAAAVEQLIVFLRNEVAVTAALGPATDRGGPILAALAARLDLPLASNCTVIDPADDGWQVTRLRWGGMLYEDALLRAPMALVTVAPNQVEIVMAPAPAVGTVRTHTPALGTELFVTRPVDHEVLAEGIGLTSAPVVIAGGRGVGSAEGFALLEELAELLGGAVGCSRVATNAGWRPHRDQVGQTGTRVAPELYIACGISGATQHWVGCMNAGRILAVNTDPDAPMVTRAHHAVIGDLHELLPALLAEIHARQR